MSALDLVLARAEQHGLRKTGEGRYRMRGVCHGGNTIGSVSIGEGSDGTVLLKCWSGCGIDQIASALGLDLSDLFPEKPKTSEGSSPLRRRNLISAGEALDLLHDEAQLVGLCAANIANRIELTDSDCKRVLQAAGRIAYLRDEVRT